MDDLIKKVVAVLGIAGALYHLYLVIHPHTPLSSLNIPLLDLTQIQRAAHVCLIAALGYLVSIIRGKDRSVLGGLPLAFMTGAVVLEFLYLPIPTYLKIAAVVTWILVIFPTMISAVNRSAALICAGLSIPPFIYLYVTYEKLIYRAIMPEPFDLLMSISEILLVLGVIFRLSGPIMPSLVMIFFLYNLYGDNIPGLFSNPGFDLDMLLGKLYCETEAGIFGSITGVSLKYLIYFTILGAIVTRLNFGKIIANIALLFVGRSPASPGRACSVMAVLMGMFSGSGAADTQFVATLTKPLFDKVGYDKLVAAGIIATVGSVAYITPPVMGSISFIMVELLSIPYSHIIAMAITPMLLYLFSIITYNELYVKREGLPQLEISSLIDFSYFKRYCYVFIPIIIIIMMIYRGYSINITVTVAAIMFVVFAFADPSIRPPFSNLLKALEEGVTGLLPIASAVIAANMIMSMMVMSGLASKFSIFLMDISGTSILLATIFTGCFSLILGMGVPPIATYVLTSALTAPTIQKLAVMNGIPEEAALLATHMFLFYFAVLAEVTPPVALSAYAASAVLGTDPIKTGVYAARVALPKYFIGVTFILSFSGTGLLIMPVLTTMHGFQALGFIVSRIFFSLIAILTLNVAVVGFFRKRLLIFERLIAGACAIILFYPDMRINSVAAALSLLLLIKKWIENKGVS